MAGRESGYEDGKAMTKMSQKDKTQYALHTPYGHMVVGTS